jgi:hypothetical protein
MVSYLLALSLDPPLIESLQQGIIGRHLVAVFLESFLPQVLVVVHVHRNHEEGFRSHQTLPFLLFFLVQKGFEFVVPFVDILKKGLFR